MPIVIASSIGRRLLGPRSGSEPALKFLFLVDSPVLKGAFTKVTGIQESIEVLTQRDGQNPQQSRKMPGTFQGGEVKLERGVIFELRDLVEWFSLVKRCGSAVRGPTGVTTPRRKIRSTVSIIAVTCEGDRVPQPSYNETATSRRERFATLAAAQSTVATEARQIKLVNAWPRKYQLADLDAQASDVEVESLSLVFEELVIEERFDDPVSRRVTRTNNRSGFAGFGEFSDGLRDR